ncbi:MAG: 16S rRNA (adenine(1518)-N(6)/adenine(1519)-N(6))-dimethyltransferase RsmA [Lachnospiraceae bacterium]|nr:16S rRNA (adenine(1518)-N(6)/adenine(1519)-N(6))-dimethyltransferase RsmA [Lachnospiraceae bacterium]
MATLGDPKNTISVLQRHGITAQKRFGQNFLIDPHVLEKIVRAADITKEDFVLEIGPGIGTLTQYLCEAAGKVCAVEIDQNLIPVLADTLAAYGNVSVLHADVLKVDLKDLLAREAEGRPVKVVANLPYYITTPILMQLLEDELPLRSITVMIQKEVAQRMAAAPGTKDYGALTLAVQYYAEPYLAANVPPHCFLPRPTVGSAVIRLTLHEEPPVRVSDRAHMFALVRAAFQQRRKTLANAASHYAGLDHTREEVAAALARIGLPDTVRGEALSLEQFAALSEALQGKA